MKNILLTIIAAVTAAAAMGHTPYTTLDERAQRAFSHAEWASAAALLDLMLEQRPETPSVYGQAIVSNAMRADTTEQMRLLEKALSNRIPFDSVFSQVKQWSFHIGNFRVYEDFLLQAQEAHPWMKRTVNATLLKFYDFRCNGNKIITCAQAMLDGAPDNVTFLSSLAKGYMLTGCHNEAMQIYRKILQIDPSNYNALLTLGNWLAMHPDGADNGRSYLEKAQQLHPTPFVERLLATPGGTR